LVSHLVVSPGSEKNNYSHQVPHYSIIAFPIQIILPLEKEDRTGRAIIDSCTDKSKNRNLVEEVSRFEKKEGPGGGYKPLEP